MVKKDKIIVEIGQYVIVQGPAYLKVMKGCVEIFGCKICNGDDTTVISGRQIPITPLQASEILLKIGNKGKYEYIGENPIPNEWLDIYTVLKKETKFKVMVLGDIDVGKSSLILYLTNKLVSDGLKIGVVDADIGQSDIGPPGTIGLAVIDKNVASFNDIDVTDAYFVGDKTPTGHLLPVVVGTRKMVDKAFDYGVDGVLINTTGFIYGGVARALKKYKIEAVSPTHIIGISYKDEIKPLLRNLQIMKKAILLSVPKFIGRKERSERRVFRHLKMGMFFKEPRVYMYDMNRVIIENTVVNATINIKYLSDLVYSLINVYPESVFLDRDDLYLFFKNRLDKSRYMRIFNKFKEMFNNVKIISLDNLRGLYLGLYKDDVFVGVGRLEDIDLKHKKVIFQADSGIGEIDKIVFGYLILDEEFNERASVKPGYLG